MDPIAPDPRDDPHRYHAPSGQSAATIRAAQRDAARVQMLLLEAALTPISWSISNNQTHVLNGNAHLVDATDEQVSDCMAQYAGYMHAHLKRIEATATQPWVTLVVRGSLDGVQVEVFATIQDARKRPVVTAKAVQP